MEPVTVIESAAVPLPYSDIDTDQIVPSAYLTSRTTEEFARALFAQRRTDPDFVLNRPGLAGRSIMVAGRNFGCGSSREQAVWAMLAGGFRAVVAPSFGEIFATNAVKNGLLPVQVDVDRHAAIVRAVDAEPDLRLTVDLRTGTVTAADVTATFEVDPFYRELLLTGQRELDYLLGLIPEIEAYEAGPALHPVTATRIGTR